jgi:HrpA-like RNA helicase
MHHVCRALNHPSYLAPPQINYDLLTDLLAAVIGRSRADGAGAFLTDWPPAFASGRGDTSGGGAILVFLPGAPEIGRLQVRAAGACWWVRLFGGVGGRRRRTSKPRGSQLGALCCSLGSVLLAAPHQHVVPLVVAPPQRALLGSERVAAAAGGRSCVRVLPLHGSLSSADQARVFARCGARQSPGLRHPPGMLCAPSRSLACTPGSCLCRQGATPPLAALPSERSASSRPYQRPPKATKGH